MKKINIYIVDDHQVVINGLISMLKTESDFNVAGFALHAEDALKYADCNPMDIALIDINLPNMDGVELCKQILKLQPSTKIIALSSFNEASFIKSMMQNGAKGYLLKNTSGEELIKAIKTVNQGQDYLSEDVQKTLISSSLGKSQSSYIPKITRREKEVLSLITEEFTTKEIAEKLFISIATVETHRLHLLSKFGVKNTAGLVKVAIQKGLIA
jgi:DNA-binding NarL/FixJ family response regulator